ncbi:unnamed protein product [Notodromas monacha]|uniref:Rho-GAP domain-containing protein n=1 Tax=Notodromas monacha TaxID=399045 RepID=A0A7R9GHY3_9CRUS|nr:unnamed protein product [Notodromas monacha]CAG0922006.1 unnamed protein product [Notodromas monacha]
METAGSHFPVESGALNTQERFNLEEVEEVNWFRDVGLDHVIEPFLSGNQIPEEDVDEAVGMLPPHYQASVKKRVATLNDTLALKKKEPRPHIRSIFVPENLLDIPTRPRSLTDEKLHAAEHSSRADDERDFAFGPDPYLGFRLIHHPLRKLSENHDSHLFSKNLFPKKSKHSASGIVARGAGEEGIESLKYSPKGTMYKRPRPKHEGNKSEAVQSSGDASHSFQNHIRDLEMSFRDVALQEASLDHVAEGLTRIDDLGAIDVNTVRRIAFLELTAIFDRNGVKFSHKHPKFPKRKQVKKKDEKSSELWGLDLLTLVERDWERGLLDSSEECVPVVLQKIIKCLEQVGYQTEGIMRVSGNQSKVDALKTCLEKNLYSNTAEAENGLCQAGPHELSSLFKMFLRDLPTPLIPPELTDLFLKVLDLHSAIDMTRAANLLVLLLPVENVCCLRCVLKVLKGISGEEDANRMSLSSICHVMAPNLFVSPKLAQSGVMEVQMATAAKSSLVLQQMVKLGEVIDLVPPSLMYVMRRQRDSFLHRKAGNKTLATPAGSDQHPDLGGRVLAIGATINGGAPVPTRVTRESTAGHVVHSVLEAVMNKLDLNRCARDRQDGRRRRVLSDLTNEYPVKCLLAAANPDIARRTHYLIECGGNLGERRLPPEANVFAILEINPRCEFFVRCAHRLGNSVPTSSNPAGKGKQQGR